MAIQKKSNPMRVNGRAGSINIPGSDASDKKPGKGIQHIVSKHILVIDDDTGLLALMRMRLESMGYTVDSAENGWDGLSKLGHAHYDVVLLDYMMPGLTGLTVLQCMLPRHPSVPVIMMTSHTGSQVAALAVAAGARACLAKPVDPMELDRALQCCVGTAA